MENSDLPPFRILSIDGGGMRGLYTATLLKTLAQRYSPQFKKCDPDIGKAFHLISGTSTGAILACALAAGTSLEKIQDLYVKFGSRIFRSSVPKPQSAFQWVRFIVWIIKHLTRPAADSKVLKQALEICFGDLTLEEVYANRDIALCVPAIDASNHQSWVFKTPHGENFNRDDSYRLVDVCLASASAPIFFGIANQENPDNKLDKRYFVDGGLWSNNPVLTGLIEALRITPPNQPIEIISVGTCDQPTGDPHSIQNPDWGLFDWKVGIKAIEMSLAAQSYGHTNMARFLADYLDRNGRSVYFLRLEENKKSPEQYSAIGLDRADPTAIDTLVTLGSGDAHFIYSQTLTDPSNKYTKFVDIFKTLTALET